MTSRRGRVVVVAVAAFVVAVLIAAGDALREVIAAEWHIWQLDAESETARKNAVARLVELKARRAIPHLCTRFRKEPGSVPQTLSDAGRALVEFGEPAVGDLVNALNDESVSVRQLAAVALGRIGAVGKEAALRLVEALRDSSPEVRVAASLALVRMSVAAVPTLRAALRDPNHQVRQLAATTLAKCGPAARQAVPELQTLSPPSPFDPLEPADSAADSEPELYAGDFSSA